MYVCLIKKQSSPVLKMYSANTFIVFKRKKILQYCIDICNKNS